MVLLVVLSALPAASLVALACIRARSRARAHTPLVGCEPRTERIEGRILFVDCRQDELVLDCVAGAGHPAMCSLAPGTPFTLSVEPAGPEWFGDAVEGMVVRWAEEDAVVEFLVTAGPEGERVDVRGNRSRVRLDVRAHAGLG